MAWDCLSSLRSRTNPEKLRWPVQRPRAVNRFLDHWKPDAALFVESEIWPNLLLTAAARGVRLALINARISERSAAGWQMSFHQGTATAAFDPDT